MSSDEAINSIRIKTGSLRRLFKERAMYADEVVAGQRKVASMREANAERYDVAQQENVLKESEMMVQDNATRLEDAYNSLAATSEHFAQDGLVKASAEYVSAVALLKEVEAVLKR